MAASIAILDIGVYEGPVVLARIHNGSVSIDPLNTLCIGK